MILDIEPPGRNRGARLIGACLHSFVTEVNVGCGGIMFRKSVYRSCLATNATWVALRLCSKEMA